MVIDKIKLFRADLQGVIDTGQLVAEGRGLEFRGKKGTLEMAPVRDVRLEGGNVRIDFGEGEGLRNVAVGDFRRGAIRTRSQNKVLVTELRAVLQLQQLSETEGDIVRERQQVQAGAALRGARVRMWVGGLAVVGGGIATAISYGTASDGGGAYFVFWGAMVFGALAFLQGLVEYRKNRSASPAPAGSSPLPVARPVPPSAPPPAPTTPPSGGHLDVERLAAERDVDALVEALWVDELDVRARAMEGLVRLGDPTVKDRLTAALGSPRWDVRWTAAETLGKLGDRRAIEALRGAVADEHALVRATAQDSLRSLEAAPA